MTFGDQNSQKEAFEQLDYALAQGINSFDVAEMYPVPPKPETCNATEIIIGNWLKDKKREELVISTKIAGPRRAIDWIRGGPKSLDEKNINEAVNNSLKRMKTDYVDLLYLHWPERNVPMFGQYKFEPEEEFINSHSGHTQRQSRRLVADPIQSGPALGPSYHSPARIARLGRLVARPTNLARNRRWRRTQPLPYQSPRLPLSPLLAPLPSLPTPPGLCRRTNPP